MWGVVGFNHLVFAQPAHWQEKNIKWGDLPEAFQKWCQTRQLTEIGFEQLVRSIHQQTVERELKGEYDHLIHFALQSNRFTKQPRIEPAISSYEFVQSLSEAERTRYLNDEVYVPKPLTLPSVVTLRLRAFIDALKNFSTDERIVYFQRFIAQTLTRDESKLDRLSREYARAMKFLYRKEFHSRSIKTTEELTEYVASLYQNRGHSTDTQFEANYALYQALAAIKALAPKTQINRVLIVGPGMDFAPRTDLMDLFGAQSYQPFAVADALLSLQLTSREQLHIHCADINERVIAFVQGLKQQKSLSLSLLSGLAETPERPLAEDYKQYFASFGRQIGTESVLTLPEKWRGRMGKKLTIAQDVGNKISASNFNVITSRYETPAIFDLVIVTNVFPYFSDVELGLALANITAMLKPDGYLLHNESRKEINSLALLLGVPALQSRTVLIAGNQENPLFDGVAIHQKK